MNAELKPSKDLRLGEEQFMTVLLIWWTSKEDCLEAGAVLMRSISEYYAGTKLMPEAHSQ